MSITLPLAGVLQEPESTLLTSTDVTDVLEVEAGRADVITVIGITIVNEDSSARLVTLWWTKDTTDRCIFEQSVSANSTVTLAVEVPIKLSAKVSARKIRAQAAAADVVTVTVTYTATPQSQPPQ